MANDLNVVNLIGRLVRDPELRTTGGGTSVLTMGLALNKNRKDAAGEWTETSHFFDVTCFGSLAENVAKYMTKGSQVGVSGFLEQQRWENDAGEKRSKVVVIANQIQFIGSRNGGDPDSGPRDRTNAVSAVSDDEDAIPFHNDGFPSWFERNVHSNR